MSAPLATANPRDDRVVARNDAARPKLDRRLGDPARYDVATPIRWPTATVTAAAMKPTSTMRAALSSG